MTSRPPAQCLFCRHWQSPLDRGDSGTEPTQVCDAFPKAIPDDIWWGRADHREPFTGDNGIQWEPLGDAEFPDWALTA